MRAVTVTGEIDEASMGITLAHEHLYVDSRFLCSDPSAIDVPIGQVDEEQLRAEPMRFVQNLDMRDERIAEAELSAFSAAGGKTLVDLTCHGLSRDPELLRRLSISTATNIIMGTGWYVEAAHPAGLTQRGCDALAGEMVDEIVVGVGPNKVRAGVIGEIGTGDPFTDAERLVVAAAARAHLETGAPVNVHMAAGCRQVMAVLDVFADEGVRDLSRVIISHMDVVLDLPQQREVISRGAIVEYDTFGHENYPDSRGFLMPTDDTRLQALATLWEEGLIGRVLVSHDVCQRSLWLHYGGHGYTKLLADLPTRLASVGLPSRVWMDLLTVGPQGVFGYLPT
ncbi:phosphotriesterase family protein [Candidatus Poriferisodalis sp.]|uniref:phosphotriesterase family protein n=1 Tax=Candidatus Poriferisodalis sp. TaxID=3101277 RepID=UPI003AF43F94